MSNVCLSSNMERTFIDNIQIKTYLDINDYMTHNHSYIHGFLKLEILQSFYVEDEDLIISWMFLAKNPQGNKFDIGEYKGVYPIRFETEPDYERDSIILKIEFSIDHINHINQYSMEERNKRLTSIKKKSEYFDKELFEL